MHSRTLPERLPDQVKVATKSKDLEVGEGEGEGEMALESMKWWH